MSRTTFGFAARMTGGNVRAAQAQGLPVGWLMVDLLRHRRRLRRPRRLLRGRRDPGQANASLVAGYGFTGILVAFLARQNPLAIVPVAILFGALGGGGRPDPAPHGHARRHRSWCCRASCSSCSWSARRFYGRFKIFQPKATGDRT